MAETWHNRREVQRSWSTRQGKPWLSQGNSILTSIIIFLLLSHALVHFLVLYAAISLSLSLSLSSTPLADSLTGSVPLANHSALIMRIISSHHSPRCASSISSGLFTRHQPLPINPFICVRVCLWLSVWCVCMCVCTACVSVKCNLLLHNVCLSVCLSVSVTIHSNVWE